MYKRSTNTISFSGTNNESSYRYTDISAHLSSDINTVVATFPDTNDNSQANYFSTALSSTDP